MTEIESNTSHIMLTTGTISDLPEELLVEVFINYCYGEFAEWNMFPELRLLQVNRLWRETAIATPHLWTRITYCTSHKDLAPIAVYLSRSQQMPIDPLVLCISTAADLSPFCALIQPHLTRCRKVEISIGNSDGNSGVRDELLRMLQPISVPLLQSLKLNDQCSGWPEVSTSLFAGGAPMLRHVSLNGFVPLGATLPHRSITHLQLNLRYQWAWPEFPPWITAQLSACPLLVHLDLGNISARLRPFSFQFHLPLLLTLSFNDVMWRPALNFLQAFKCPSLQQLNISVRLGLPEAIPFPQFAFPSLRKLSIHHQNEGPPPFLTLSDAFPLITEISLISSYGNAALIHHLCTCADEHDSGASAVIVWPHLQTIGISSQIPVDEMRVLLVKRSEAGRPVTRVLLPMDRMPKEGCDIALGMDPPVLVEEFLHAQSFDLL